MISVKIIADSLSTSGPRLTTMVLRYPRFIHSEVMTHRTFSRNAASSRAIPVKKMLEEVMTDPAMPVFWGKNQAGMQAKEELSGVNLVGATGNWLLARDRAVDTVRNLMDLGLHKQIANRILEPWMHIVTIVTATEWKNFYHLRRHSDAQPEFKVLADAMYTAQSSSIPKYVASGEWHLPFIRPEEFLARIPVPTLLKYSVARCARVSYLNHDGTHPDPAKDLILHESLLSGGHMSPFEHQATPAKESGFIGNFREWKQYRKTIPNEDVYQNVEFT